MKKIIEKEKDMLYYGTSIEYKWERIDPRNIFIWEDSVDIVSFDEEWNKYSETIEIH